MKILMQHRGRKVPLLRRSSFVEMAQSSPRNRSSISEPLRPKGISSFVLTRTVSNLFTECV